MNAMRRLVILMLAGATSVALMPLAHAQGFPDYKTNNEWNPTVAEFQQLPAYCQAQFRPQQSNARPAPAYPCGPNFNHFCPGLVALNRAGNFSGSKQQRLFVLGIAERSVVGVREKLLPNCPLAEDVAFAERRVKLLRTLVK
jgi:hypothetical protein